MPQYFTNSPSVDTIEADPPGLVGARFNGVLRAATDTITIPASTSAASMFGIVPIMSSALVVAIQYSWTALGGTDWGHAQGGRICINKPRPEPASLNSTYEIPYTAAAGLSVDSVGGTLAYGVNCEFEGDSGVVKDFGKPGNAYHASRRGRASHLWELVSNDAEDGAKYTRDPKEQWVAALYFVNAPVNAGYFTLTIYYTDG